MSLSSQQDNSKLLTRSIILLVRVAMIARAIVVRVAVVVIV